MASVLSLTGCESADDTGDSAESSHPILRAGDYTTVPLETTADCDTGAPGGDWSGDGVFPALVASTGGRGWLEWTWTPDDPVALATTPLLNDGLMRFEGAADLLGAHDQVETTADGCWRSHEFDMVLEPETPTEAIVSLSGNAHWDFSCLTASESLAYSCSLSGTWRLWPAID